MLLVALRSLRFALRIDRVWEERIQEVDVGRWGLCLVDLRGVVEKRLADHFRLLLGDAAAPASQLVDKVEAKATLTCIF